MSAARKPQLVSVQDYLAGELISPIKHEYLGGVVYAMAGARNLHTMIKVNTLARLHERLRGKPCRPFDSDAKIRIHLPTHVRFYYPDASVICHPNPVTDSYQDNPTVLFEILSRGTRRIDEGEKRDAYLTIPSLRVYVLLEQDAAAAQVYRRTEQGFVREIYEGLEAVVPLDEIGTSLPFTEIYEGIEFTPEDDADEE